jgi:hypothetical protein
MRLPSFGLRDLFWLTFIVAMGLGWWVQTRRPASVYVGQMVYVVRLDRDYGWNHIRAIVTSLSRDGFHVDTSISAPIRDGIVVNAAGDYLGVVADDHRSGIKVIAIPLSR